MDEKRWELVSVTTYSSYMSLSHVDKLVGTGPLAYNVWHSSDNVAGFTTEEILIFKRPKS